MEKKVTSKVTGVVDEPVKGSDDDMLGIHRHTKSLINFVERTETPITIGIQGEWGSGKTSLINSIYHYFGEIKEDKKEKQIWINAWEYSLLSSPEEALLKIVNKIIDDLIGADKEIDLAEKIKEGAGQIFKGALRVGASVAFGNAASQVASELLESSGHSIEVLRKQLEQLVLEIEKRQTNPYNKIIIYVDDLDRIEPRHAVSILELLKNIFNIPNCVFILAIDYQVVVKGLEYKFGKQSPENEWEFRAFFDKIIQLPFMMPMGQYNIGKYVISLLRNIGFAGEGILDEEEISEILFYTIGGNPRSIKRLVNSVSLIQIFRETKGDDQLKEKNLSDDERFLLFAFLCLQISYPYIYSILEKKPNFSDWDADFAFKITDKAEERDKALFDETFEIAKKHHDCDEDWEKALFRICYTRPGLRTRFKKISKFLSHIKDNSFENKSKEMGETISAILNQTSVTNVTSTNENQVGPKKGQKVILEEDFWLKSFEGKVSPESIKRLKQVLDAIKSSSNYLKVNFSKTDGASFYHPDTSKVCTRLALRGSRDNKIHLYSLLKDPKHHYNTPKISGFIVNFHKKEKIFSPGKHNWTDFDVQCPIGSIDTREIEVFKALAQRNFELHSRSNEQVRNDMIDKATKVKNGDDKAKAWVSDLLDKEPYEFEI